MAGPPFQPVRAHKLCNGFSAFGVLFSLTIVFSNTLRNETNKKPFSNLRKMKII